jgi:hypothetical protein
MRSKTLHETSCIYLHPVEQSGLRITVVSFLDIMRRWLSGLWSIVSDICHNTQKSENDVGGSFWDAPKGFPEVENTVAI